MLFDETGLRALSRTGPPNKMMRMILLPFLNKTPRGNGGEWVLVSATPGIISQAG